MARSCCVFSEYLIAAPKVIRPAETLGVYVAILRTRGEHATLVRVSVTSAEVEYASVESSFAVPGSRLLQLLVTRREQRRRQTLARGHAPASLASLAGPATFFHYDYIDAKFN